MEFVFVSKSAAAGAASAILSPDRHINVKAVSSLNTRLAKAAAAFAAKVSKQSPEAIKALTAAGFKTEKQIQKALSPIGYFYMPASAKPVPYSASKEKAKDTKYLRARAIAIYQRTRPSANQKHVLICSIYNKFVVGPELYKEQQALVKAVGSHKTQKEKTGDVIKKVNADNRAAVAADFGQGSDALKAALIAGGIKESQIVETMSPTGIPSVFLKFGKTVVAVRPATAAQLRKAQAANAESETK